MPSPNLGHGTSPPNSTHGNGSKSEIKKAIKKDRLREISARSKKKKIKVSANPKLTNFFSKSSEKTIGEISTMHAVEPRIIGQNLNFDRRMKVVFGRQRTLKDFWGTESRKNEP